MCLVRRVINHQIGGSFVARRGRDSISRPIGITRFGMGWVPPEIPDYGPVGSSLTLTDFATYQVLSRRSM